MCTYHKSQIDSKPHIEDYNDYIRTIGRSLDTMFGNVAKRCESHLLQLIQNSNDILNNSIKYLSNTTGSTSACGR
jgi:hypothetical protein